MGKVDHSVVLLSSKYNLQVQGEERKAITDEVWWFSVTVRVVCLWMENGESPTKKKSALIVHMPLWPMVAPIGWSRQFIVNYKL